MKIIITVDREFSKIETDGPGISKVELIGHLQLALFGIMTSHQVSSCDFGDIPESAKPGIQAKLDSLINEEKKKYKPEKKNPDGPGLGS